MACVRMNFKQLENLVLQGESAFLEFKTSTGQLKSAFETEFEEPSGGFVIIFRFKQPMGGSQVKEVQEKGLDLNLSMRQQKILEILADGALLSAKEIREKLDVDVSSRSIRADLNFLKNNGCVQQVGISVASSWKKNNDK